MRSKCTSRFANVWGLRTLIREWACGGPPWLPTKRSTSRALALDWVRPWVQPLQFWATPCSHQTARGSSWPPSSCPHLTLCWKDFLLNDLLSRLHQAVSQQIAGPCFPDWQVGIGMENAQKPNFSSGLSQIPLNRIQTESDVHLHK